MPKFSSTRTFQLLLEQNGKKCSVDIDGPIALGNSKLRVFVGKTSTKPSTSRLLNGFGDTAFAVSSRCDSIRKAGVFVVLQDSRVRLRVIE